MAGIIESDSGNVDWEVMADLETIDEDGNEVYSAEFVRINNLFVKPELRGHGYARQLMLAAIDLIHTEHPGMIIKIVPEPKDSTTDLGRLASFYDSLGLEVVA